MPLPIIVRADIRIMGSGPHSSTVVRACGLEHEAVEGLCHKADMAVPVRFGHVDGQLDVHESSLAPRIKIWAVQEIGRSASTYAEDYSPKSAARLRLQDCGTQRRQPDPSRDDDQIAFGGIEIPACSERPPYADDVSDTCFAQRTADSTDSPNSMNHSVIGGCGVSTDRQGNFTYASCVHHHELAWTEGGKLMLGCGEDQGRGIAVLVSAGDNPARDRDDLLTEHVRVHRDRAGVRV